MPVVPAETLGALAGEKVAQLYVHDCVASRVRPVRELKGFQKAWVVICVSIHTAVCDRCS